MRRSVTTGHPVMTAPRQTLAGPRRRRPRGLLRGARATTAALLALGGTLSLPGLAGAVHSHAFVAPDLYGVGVRRCTFVDHSRRVLNYSTSPVSVFSPDRTLVTEIRYPTQMSDGQPDEVEGATPEARTGGYPLIVFAHGYDVTPDTYAPLLDAWTRAGFVVAAPFFPDEQPSAILAQRGVNTEGDLANEPGDLAFVTRQILAASTGASAACAFVAGLVRPDQVALAGHSDGGNAVALLAYGQGRDPQGATFASLRDGLSYRSVMVFSGDEVDGPALRERIRPTNLPWSRAETTSATRSATACSSTTRSTNPTSGSSSCRPLITCRRSTAPTPWRSRPSPRRRRASCRCPSTAKRSPRVC